MGRARRRRRGSPDPPAGHQDQVQTSGFRDQRFQVPSHGRGHQAEPPQSHQQPNAELEKAKYDSVGYAQYRAPDILQKFAKPILPDICLFFTQPQYEANKLFT